MMLQPAFISKVAAAALAVGLAGGGSVALAEERAEPVVSASAAQAQILSRIQSSQNAKGQLTRDWSVTVDPLVPIGMIAGLGGLYGLLCLFAASRRMRGAWLRAGAGGAMAVALLNPQILIHEQQPQPTQVVIVIDKSASQQLGDRGRQTDAAYAELLEDLSKVKGIEVRTVEVGDKDGTNPFAALKASLSNIPPESLGAVIMLTDGQVHDALQGSKVLEAGVPLHVLLSGGAKERDRSIVIDSAPLYGIVGEEANIRFHVQDDGAPKNADEKVQVTITGDGKVLASRFVTPGAPVEMKLDIPHGGVNIIALEAEAVPGELTTVNNRAVASVQGVRENMNVLLVTGKPNAGERTWRNLLKSDPSLNLVHFSILKTPEKEEDVPLNELSLISVPTKELFSEKIDKFDLVIFDRYEVLGILPPQYFENIANYVKEGGSLLVVTGPEYGGDLSLYNTPLAAVLPAAPAGSVTEEPFVPGVNNMGERHPITRNLPQGDQPWGQWYRVVDVKDPSGQVIMEGPGHKPLMIVERKEKGRVAMMLSDNAWLWARNHDGGGPYDEMLRRLSHWLMQEPALEEEAINLRVEGGELIIEQQTMANEGAPVTITSPSGKTGTVEMRSAGQGVWRASIPADEIGMYSAAQGEKKTVVNVGTESPKEFADTRTTAEILKPLVSMSGGRIGRISDASGDLDIPKIVPRHAGDAGMPLQGDDWIGVRMSDVSTVKATDRMSILGGWIGFTLLLGALAAAWYREGEGTLFKRRAGKGGNVPVPAMKPE